MTLRQIARLVLHVVPGTLSVLAYAILVVPYARIVRRRPRSPRLLWGPIPIVNIRYSALADRVLGYDSRTLVYRVYRRRDRNQFDHVLERYTGRRLVGQLVPYPVLLWAGLRFDGFGFFFDGGLLGQTPFWRVELPLLRLAGKRTFAYPYGGDGRLASVTRSHGGWHAFTDVPVGEEDRDEGQVRSRMHHIANWVDVMFGFADLVEDLPRRDGVMLHAFDAENWEPVAAPADGVVRIVHASNHRHYKGTRFLIESVDRLRGEGLPVELVLVENLPYDEARRAYRDADIVAEQFLIGAYGLFAVEAMAIGKPVIAYLNPRFADAHPEWANCPIVSATPDELTDRLRTLIVDPQLRSELGARSREFALEYHSLSALAARMAPIYAEWWPSNRLVSHPTHLRPTR